MADAFSWRFIWRGKHLRVWTGRGDRWWHFYRVINNGESGFRKSEPWTT